MIRPGREFDRVMATASAKELAADLTSRTAAA